MAVCWPADCGAGALLVVGNEIMKTCRKCGVEFEGRYCKNCARLSGIEYRKKNKEKLKAYHAARWLENKETINVRNLEWYYKNKDRAKEVGIKWRKSNPEKVKGYYAKYHETHADKCRADSARYRKENPGRIRIIKQNRYVRQKFGGGKLSRDLVKKLFVLQRGKCPCCRLPLGDDYQLDHKMPLALGGEHADSNMQLLRRSCNATKQAKHPIDFMQSRGFLL